MTEIPVWVINLAQASQRKARIMQHLQRRGFSQPHWFPAVDGRLLSASDQASACVPSALLRRAGRSFTAGELGCALSHRGVWQAIAAGPEPFALVLEDDAMLADDVVPRLAELAPLLGQETPVLITLGRLRLYTPMSAQRVSASLRAVKPLRAWGAHAYVLNKAAAAELAEFQQPFRCMADDWLYYQAHTSVAVWGLDPCLAAVVPHDSHLEGDRRYVSRRKPLSWWRMRRLLDRVAMFFAEWRQARAATLLSHSDQSLERIREGASAATTKPHAEKITSQK